MTFTTKLFKLIASHADMCVDGNEVERFIGQIGNEGEAPQWEVGTANSENWWYFEDQEVVVNSQGRCSARDTGGYIVTLQFAVASYRPVEFKDLE